MKKITKRTKKSASPLRKEKKKTSLFHVPLWLIIAIICLPIFLIINAILNLARWNIFDNKKIAKTNWRQINFSSFADKYSPIPRKPYVSFRKIHDKLSNFLKKFIP